MFRNLLIASIALFATAVQSGPPGKDTFYITGVTVVHPERKVLDTGNIGTLVLGRPDELMQSIR
jgi:hypothetical protein